MRSDSYRGRGRPPVKSLTPAEVRKAQLATVEQLLKHRRILSGELWEVVIEEALDNRDAHCLKILTDRLASKTLFDHLEKKHPGQDKITINITTRSGPDEKPVTGTVIDHDDDA